MQMIEVTFNSSSNNSAPSSLGTGPEGRESCEYAGNTGYSGTVVTR
jgi:hypothetical protein